MNIDDIHASGKYSESATILRSFIPAKYSTLITEFSIYKLSSDLQRMDVYEDIMVFSWQVYFKHGIPRVSSTKSLKCTMKWKPWIKSKFFVKLHFAKIFGIL